MFYYTKLVMTFDELLKAQAAYWWLTIAGITNKNYKPMAIVEAFLKTSHKQNIFLFGCVHL